MLTISLEEMKFYAGHGVYPEERVLGNTFIVDVLVSLEETGPVEDLSQTIDYEKVYEIIKKEMATPAAMLETLAGNCISRVKQAFPRAGIIEISISKLHPPVGGETGRSRVTLRKMFAGS